MENIKKLIYKGYYKSIKVLSIFVIAILAFIGLLIISEEGIGTSAGSTTFAFWSAGAFLMILITGMALSYFRTKKRYSKFINYLEENGLSAEEDFEKLNKNIYMSKNMIIDTMNGFGATIHMKMIEDFKKSVSIIGKVTYLTLEVKLYGEEKTQHLYCLKNEIQEEIIDRINERKGINISEDEKALKSEKTKSTLMIRQGEPKKVYGAIAVIVVMVIATCFAYYYIQKNKEDNYINSGDISEDITDSSPQYLSLIDEKNDELVEVAYDGEDGEYYLALNNTSKHFFAAKLIVSDGGYDEKEFNVAIQPNGYWESDFFTMKSDPSDYKFNAVKFYESTQVSSVSYKMHFGFTFDERNIALKGERMTIENIESILSEEKSYVEYYLSEECVYYFHDVDDSYLEEYYPEDETRVYKGIIDTPNNEIRIYEYSQDDSGKLISTVKY